MLKKIDCEIFSRITKETFNNIINNNYNKCIGISSDERLINEHNKRVGRVVFIHYSEIIPVNKIKKSIDLGMFVEFKEEKGVLQSRLTSDGTRIGIWLVDPYFVKPYKPDPKVEVPIQVFNIKKGTIVTEMVKLTYKQFQENRLCVFFYNEEWKYKWVNAYHNFRRLFATSGQYYLGINSTVKHCLITQVALEKILATVDNEKRKIKSEWTRYLNQHIQTDQALLGIQRLYKTYNDNKIDNKKVVNLSDFS